MEPFINFRVLAKLLPCLFLLFVLVPAPALAGQTVIISDDVSGNVFGGLSQVEIDSSAVSDNSVIIGDSGTVTGLVYGGGAYSNAASVTASGNTVRNSGAVYGDIYGGFAYSGNTNAAPGNVLVSAVGNQVYLNDSAVSDLVGLPGDPDTIPGGMVYGGFAVSYSALATASGNSIHMNGGTIGDPAGDERIHQIGILFGGFAISYDSSATATGNSVEITGGGQVTGLTYGGYADTGSGVGTATNNSITISNGSVSGLAHGGYAFADYGSAIAAGNSVSIGSAGSVGGTAIGGFAFANTGSASASGNSLAITGGTVQSLLYGGFAEINEGVATASGNQVTISGGRIGGSVYGGYAQSDNPASAATGNSVTIGGDVTFGASSILYGGFVNSEAGAVGTAGDAFSGNRLNVWNYQGSALAGVENFEFINFIVPATSSNTPLLTANTVKLGDGADKGSTISVSTTGGTAPLRPGSDPLTLIAGTITGNLASIKAQGKHGATLRYAWTLDNAGDLGATLDSVEANPQAKALAEGYLSGLALSAQGADLLTGQGIAQAVNAARNRTNATPEHGATDGNAVAATTQGVAGDSGFGAFAAFSGGSTRYATGSHIDLDSMSLLAGLAWGMDTPDKLGHLTLGAFFEYGNGSYDTQSSFGKASGAAAVNGNGEARYLGGGLLGRMEFALGDSSRTESTFGDSSRPENTFDGSGRPESTLDTPPNSIYAETSFRLGKLDNEYRSNDLRDDQGRSADYDSASPYYGLHLGGGYIWNITEAASLDIYGKYFWTRLNGDSVTLATNDPVTFKHAKSHRLRGGMRLSYALGESFCPYVGAAYEHEFDGRARAVTYGYSLDAPALRGGTGMGEIGFNLKPTQTLPLSFDLGLQGYTGQREGITGTLRAKFEF